MPARTGATIPDPVDPSGTYRRVICIPASPEWIAIVNGLLYTATQEWYWDAATGDAEAAALRAQQMYFEFQDQNGGCDVSIPVGTVVMSAGTSVDAGWLLCDGNYVLKVDYPALWDRIGTFWGTAPDSDYFVLPDFRNRSPFGYDFGNPAHQFDFGQYTGEQAVALTAAQNGQHDHDTSTLGYSLGVVGAAGYVIGGGNPPSSSKTAQSGSGAPHNNLHPVAVCSFVIYAGN